MVTDLRGGADFCADGVVGVLGGLWLSLKGISEKKGFQETMSEEKQRQNRHVGRGGKPQLGTIQIGSGSIVEIGEFFPLLDRRGSERPLTIVRGSVRWPSAGPRRAGCERARRFRRV